MTGIHDLTGKIALVTGGSHRRGIGAAASVFHRRPTGGIVGLHYTASKAGILGLTRSYASRLTKVGITVTLLRPR